MQTAERLGATDLGDGRCQFVVWAPLVEQVEIAFTMPEPRCVPMERDAQGYHRAIVPDVAPGARYFYRLDGEKERPDPTSRLQPEGVHGPSAVVDPRAFAWGDDGWSGLPLERFVIYELHVGTFTPEGTFDAVIPHLDTLAELGVTAVEIMPVAQFPGTRNWGYDGVALFAVQDSYGGPDGLKRLVDACHRRGLAVVLDVVYNHLGPEGNYLWDYAPYFTERYHTPWGAALNFDGRGSDEVRRFFIENALQWFEDFHMDALRLDAIDAILDRSAYPFLRELADIVHARANAAGRAHYLIAESDMNDVRVIRSPEQAGYGMDAQWSDDFHHALHVLLTGEQLGYYADFTGITDLAHAYRENFVYAGKYSSHRQRRHGNRARPAEGRQFVICAQNHDQVGNRITGDRLSQLLPFDMLKLAAGVLLLAPYVPLLFMGEEYGASTPFQFFTSHGDPALIEAVRQGRQSEFAAFRWQGEVPDPHDPATFARSILRHGERDEEPHRTLWEFYRELLRLRRTVPALATLDPENLDIAADETAQVLTLSRWAGESRICALFNFSETEQRGSVGFSLREDPQAEADATNILNRGWTKLLDSAEERWRGTGSTIPAILPAAGETPVTLQPRSLALFTI